MTPSEWERALHELLDLRVLDEGSRDVDYRVPILFRPEPYAAWSWASRVGQRSATIESIICDGETVLARARVAMVFFDPRTERSVAPPETYLEGLRSLLVS